MNACAGVADGGARLEWLSFWRARDTHRTTSCLGDHVEALVARVRSVGTKPLDLSVDDPWVELTHDVIAQAQFLNRAWTIVFDEYIEVRHKLFEERYPFGVFQIDSDTFFVRIEKQEIG